MELIFLTVSTVLSSTSRETHTAAGDRVVLGSVSTQRHPSTVDSVTAGWTRCQNPHTSEYVIPLITPPFSAANMVSGGLTDVAAGSYKPCWTFAGSGGRNALPSIFTLAPSLTVWAIETLSTS